MGVFMHKGRLIEMKLVNGNEARWSIIDGREWEHMQCHNENFFLLLNEEMQENFLQTYDAIIFRNSYIYAREKEIQALLRPFKIDLLFVNSGERQFRIDLKLKRNKHLEGRSGEIEKEITKLPYVDKFEEKGRYLFIHHSSDVKEEWENFFSN